VDLTKQDPSQKFELGIKVEPQMVKINADVDSQIIQKA
jgi:hypothetical protein